MPRASFLVSALLFLWVASAAARPVPVAWNLATPDQTFRIVRVMPTAHKAPEPGIDWPATRTRVDLGNGREAWIWKVSRVVIPAQDQYEIDGLALKAPLADILCFGCTPADEETLAAVVGKPSSSNQDPDTLHPYSPIALMISDASAYPNPFNPFTDDATISVTLTDDAEVSIKAYDWNGQYVATVFSGSWVTGLNQTLWSGQTEDGRKLGNGVYFLRVVAKSGTRQEAQIIKVAVWNER